MHGVTGIWAVGFRPVLETSAVAEEGPEVPSPAASNALDDRSLVARSLAGSGEAFDAIVERHQRTVYRLCYRFVGRHEDAADLAQEIFLRAYRGLKRFRGDASLGTWLYRIGVNVCLNRASRREPVFTPLGESRQVGDPAADPASALLSAERAERVRAAIALLPSKQRATLILRVYQDLSHQEIATVLGGSVGSAKANLFHALRNLKKILERDRL